MSQIEWLRFLPFLLAGLVLLEWSLIVILETKPDGWDWLNVSLAGLGIVVGTYLLSLSLDTGAGFVTFGLLWFDGLRTALTIVALIGFGPSTVYLWRLVKRRIRELFRRGK